MSLKTDVLEAIAGKNRGLLVNDDDKIKILSVVEKLEDENPHPQPFKTPELLEGNWRLLYTTSKSILGLNNFPLLQLGSIYQYIRMESNKIYNIAEINGLPFLEGLVSVVASFSAISDHTIDVNFERSIIGLQRILNYISPVEFINQIESGKKFLPIDFNITNDNQQGWLKITYLDEDLRIGRGNQGNMFILAKEK